MTKPHEKTMWYNTLSGVSHIDAMVENINATTDLINNTGKCLFLVKSTNENSSFTMGTSDCNERKSSVICKKGPVDPLYAKQPPSVPCMAQNKNSRKTRQVKRDTQGGKMIINSGEEKGIT